MFLNTEYLRWHCLRTNTIKGLETISINRIKFSPPINLKYILKWRIFFFSSSKMCHQGASNLLNYWRVTKTHAPLLCASLYPSWCNFGSRQSWSEAKFFLQIWRKKKKGFRYSFLTDAPKISRMKWGLILIVFTVFYCHTKVFCN